MLKYVNQPTGIQSYSLHDSLFTHKIPFQSAVQVLEKSDNEFSVINTTGDTLAGSWVKIAYQDTVSFTLSQYLSNEKPRLKD